MPTYKWTKLNVPLKYPVYENGKVVIPAGTSDVEIAYGQSSKHLYSKDKWPIGKMQNAYRWNGVIYNA